MLEGEGFNVMVVSDGNEGVRSTEKCSQIPVTNHFGIYRYYKRRVKLPLQRNFKKICDDKDHAVATYTL